MFVIFILMVTFCFNGHANDNTPACSQANVQNSSNSNVADQESMRSIYRAMYRLQHEVQMPSQEKANDNRSRTNVEKNKNNSKQDKGKE